MNIWAIVTRRSVKFRHNALFSMAQMHRTIIHLTSFRVLTTSRGEWVEKFVIEVIFRTREPLYIATGHLFPMTVILRTAGDMPTPSSNNQSIFCLWELETRKQPRRQFALRRWSEAHSLQCHPVPKTKSRIVQSAPTSYPKKVSNWNQRKSVGTLVRKLCRSSFMRGIMSFPFTTRMKAFHWSAMRSPLLLSHFRLRIVFFRFCPLQFQEHKSHVRLGTFWKSL